MYVTFSTPSMTELKVSSQSSPIRNSLDFSDQLNFNQLQLTIPSTLASITLTTTTIDHHVLSKNQFIFFKFVKAKSP